MACNTIKNKYLVFVHSSWHRAPKILGIYCLLYANEMVPVVGVLDSFQMKLVARITNQWLEF